MSKNQHKSQHWSPAPKDGRTERIKFISEGDLFVFVCILTELLSQRELMMAQAQ